MNKADEMLKQLLDLIRQINQRLDRIEKCDAERREAWALNQEFIQQQGAKNGRYT